MTWQQLKNLPVFTRGGSALGRIVGVVFDPETHAIVQYEVRQGLALSRRVLLVAASQVVSITAERMTVEDLVGRPAEAKSQSVPAPETPAGGLAAMRKIS